MSSNVVVTAFDPVHGDKESQELDEGNPYVLVVNEETHRLVSTDVCEDGVFTIVVEPKTLS